MIEVTDLSKSFGAIRAVDGVSFQVAKGDVLGFLGPNGAGKSTTMKMLCCFLPPDGGTARVAGHDIRRDPVSVRRDLGYLAETAPGYDEMTVEGLLGFVCDVRGIHGKARKAAFERVMDQTALESVWRQPLGTLSKGYRRRVGLAQALIHDPPVLIMDEPTDGLDPNQKRDVRRLISGLAKQDKCIVVSTHILEEVDAICNRLVIISRGRVLADDTPTGIRQKHKGDDLNTIFHRLTLKDAKAQKEAVA